MHITSTLYKKRLTNKTFMRRGIHGGLLMLAGAVGFGAHIVARSFLTAGVDVVASAQNPLWIPVNVLGAVGAGLVLLGTPAISSRFVKPGSRIGVTGLGLVAGSWMFFGVFLGLYGALVQPWLAGEAPGMLDGSPPLAFAVTFAIGALAWLGGSVIVAREARDRWVRYLLPASGLWFLVGSFALAPDGPANELGMNLLSNMGPVLLAAGFGRAGYQAWRKDSAR